MKKEYFTALLMPVNCAILVDQHIINIKTIYLKWEIIMVIK